MSFKKRANNRTHGYKCLGIIDTGGCIVECQFRSVAGSAFCEKHIRFGSVNNIHGISLISRRDAAGAATEEK